MLSLKYVIFSSRMKTRLNRRYGYTEIQYFGVLGVIQERWNLKLLDYRVTIFIGLGVIDVSQNEAKQTHSGCRNSPLRVMNGKAKKN